MSPIAKTTDAIKTLANQINTAHRQAYGSAKKAVEYAAECGRLLIKAKELIPHGEWGRWLDKNTEVGWRQSQKYMRLANNWEAIQAKSDSDSHLNIEAALKLLREPPEEMSKYLERTGQRLESTTSACGTPLWHRNEDGVMVDSQTLEPIETEDEEEPRPPPDPDAIEIGKLSEDERDALERMALTFPSNAMEAAEVLEDNEGVLEITDELIQDCKDVAAAWDKLATRFIKKRASTLPQDWRSEGAVVDPTDITIEKNVPLPARGKLH